MNSYKMSLSGPGGRGRRLLSLGLAGYGKYGRSLFNELNLVSPEEAGKPGEPIRRKVEGEHA